MKQFIAVLLMCATLPALANPSDCNMINNDDARYYCQAVSKQDASYCNMINNDDKRHMCQAVSKHNPNYCNMINDDDKRYECKGQAGY